MPGEKHYIAVDRKMVMRCGWCGTAESSYWIQGDQGGDAYCSSTCKDADSVDKTLARTIGSLALCFFLVIPSGLIVYNAQGLVGFDFILGLGILTTIIALCPLSLNIASLLAGSKARKKTPRNSRRLDKVFDKRYLHCVNCNAPLELMHGKTSVKCSYCGFV
ncbi:MAG: hypothetical protein ACFFFO_17080, partial [Candidatus Thorarchaeota archaeon]